MPPKGRTRVNNKHWKPSTTECRDSLFLLVPSAGDIDATRKRKVDLMFSRGQTIQPYILLVGPTLTNILAAYVIIDDNTYKTESVLEAIDFCFKSFHVLDATYPFQSEHIWFLFQRNIYNIRTKYDKSIPFIQDLLI